MAATTLDQQITDAFLRMGLKQSDPNWNTYFQQVKATAAPAMASATNPLSAGYQRGYSSIAANDALQNALFPVMQQVNPAMYQSIASKRLAGGSGLGSAISDFASGPVAPIIAAPFLVQGALSALAPQTAGMSAAQLAAADPYLASIGAQTAGTAGTAAAGAAGATGGGFSLPSLSSLTSSLPSSMSSIGNILTNPLVKTGLGTVGSYLKSSGAQDAATQAAAIQSQAAQSGINAQQAQFDKLMQNLKPFIETGTSAVGAQGALAGLGGIQAQMDAINALASSPTMQALTKQGEMGILQNAAATGGLRGGRTQEALAQFRPQMLSQLIQQQFQNLGGLSQLGQSAAAGGGTAGMNLGANVANLLQGQGQAQAGSVLGKQAIQSNMVSDILSSLGQLSTPSINMNLPTGTSVFNPAGGF